ncbi:MAG: NADH-quinone oxidoreductase subunit J [Planctomycetota bacterium]
MPESLVQLILYAATVLGAAAMVLLLPAPGKPGGTSWRPLGALLGAATLGGFWLLMSPLWLDRPRELEPYGDALTVTGLDPGAMAFYYVFSAIGIVSAVRVITHHRPVYAALWFVLVILSSAGLFLVLAAEFMALALVMIYGGAILVTYMFVIMLASQPQASDAPEDTPDFERYAREPLWASVAGFLLLAVLLTFIFDGDAVTRNVEAMAITNAEVAEQLLPNRAQIAAVDGGGDVITVDTAVGNVERVGLDLFMQNPLAIELAGVILLLSLIGAVVIAKTDVPDPGSDENDDPAVRAAVDPKPAPEAQA